ncbi:winged helix-turn-helix domain-containing protein [Pseudogemmobacter sp. W21_MBD1_M6]|uniref:winged helix-turn-helix domain-containing protein n=1 Tax=Pseudogemmobacter sp. W21_MBD1_M6 TaxID=3240271 RepID=UPI003F988FA8
MRSGRGNRRKETPLTPLAITNRDARRLWLSAQGLAETPTGPLDTMAIIRRLGFVQLDTIRAVERAHHHIIWSRNNSYREHMLNPLLADDRSLFEHYTHDASVIPTEYYPMWQRQFRRKKERIGASDWFGSMCGPAEREAIRARIAHEGPLSTHAFETRIEGAKEMWQRPPHKLALDYMWYAGELATSHRRNFTKFYDLAENVIPDHIRTQSHDDAAQIDWLCHAALNRLSFGTLTEIRRFWEATEVAEVKGWAANAALIPVTVQAADGSWSDALAPADIEDRLVHAAPPTSRLRILNPFDPVVRDRDRLKRLFGFDYRIEIFVPAAKRQWGYYVFPLLEGDRLIGRIEAKADRTKAALDIIANWREPAIKWTAPRAQKLEAELARFARFAGLDSVTWSCPATP